MLVLSVPLCLSLSGSGLSPGFNLSVSYQELSLSFVFSVMGLWFLELQRCGGSYILSCSRNIDLMGLLCAKSTVT